MYPEELTEGDWVWAVGEWRRVDRVQHIDREGMVRLILFAPDWGAPPHLDHLTCEVGLKIEARRQADRPDRAGVEIRRQRDGIDPAASLADPGLIVLKLWPWEVQAGDDVLIGSTWRRVTITDKQGDLVHMGYGDGSRLLFGREKRVSVRRPGVNETPDDAAEFESWLVTPDEIRPADRVLHGGRWVVVDRVVKLSRPSDGGPVNHEGKWRVDLTLGRGFVIYGADDWVDVLRAVGAEKPRRTLRVDAPDLIEREGPPRLLHPGAQVHVGEAWLTVDRLRKTTRRTSGTAPRAYYEVEFKKSFGDPLRRTYAGDETLRMRSPRFDTQEAEMVARPYRDDDATEEPTSEPPPWPTFVVRVDSHGAETIMRCMDSTPGSDDPPTFEDWVTPEPHVNAVWLCAELNAFDAIAQQARDVAETMGE